MDCLTTTGTLHRGKVKFRKRAFLTAHTEVLPEEERPIRLLYVQHDGDAMQEIREAARRLPSRRFLIQSCNPLSVAMHNRAADTFDMVLIEWGDVSRDGLDALAACRNISGASYPLLVITHPADDLGAVEIIQHRPHDLVSPQCTTRALVRTIRLALERQHYAQSYRPAQFLPQEENCSLDPVPGQSHADLRRDSRYFLTRPVYAVPVLPGTW